MRFSLFAAAVVALFVLTPISLSSEESWVERSNRNAEILLNDIARFNPELAGQLGVDGFDEEVVDLRENLVERSRSTTASAIEKLEARQREEKDPAVLQDLEILLKAARDDIRGSDLYDSYQLPYYNVARIVFMGLRSLLDDQIPEERRKAALVRLKKYTGIEEGYTPVTVLAAERIRERLDEEGLRGPVRAEVEKDLADMQFFVSGIPKLFEKYDLDGFEEGLEALSGQLDTFAQFIREEVMPRATDDFRLPEKLYAYNLEQLGVDIPPDQLASRARSAFAEIQAQMQEIASVLTKEKGTEGMDYRDTIRELKKDQLVGEAILPFYQSRIRDLEEIIRREKILTLPDREMLIRLASEAESAASPAPHMRPPRLVGNEGEMGEFVLPLRIPGGDGADQGKQYDDFTFAAASWTLTAHEGRPGHELQFASMVEKGVSTARSVFAFNSVNVEGWGLYSEAIVFPFLPPEGQLVALQHRLARAARAFLDPGLQEGSITKEEAHRILREDVVLSEAMATQEVDRYTFRAPGQATSYFYGFLRLTELRSEVEELMGDAFDQMRFHDFVLSQGLLPPHLIRDAVQKEFGIRLKQG